MELARYINRQNIERFSKLLEFVSDETQRRQITNLLEEERELAMELQASRPSSPAEARRRRP
jgi:hypothetical protein